MTSQVYGALASTAEVLSGQRYFEQIADTLRGHGIEVELAIQHDRSIRKAILTHAAQVRPDLIVMGAHGHKGFTDLLYGTTIDAVRHGISVPLLIVTA